MSGVPLQPESLVVALGRPEREPGVPLNAPVVLAAPFHFTPAADVPGFGPYVRTDGSATTTALEAALGALDGGQATVFSSGMAAVAAVIESLPVGTVLVAPTAAYWGVLGLVKERAESGHLELRQVDIADTDAVLAALPGADMLWVETCTNPMLSVCELDVLIEAAHAHGAIVGVDATFTTPLNVRPLDLGADVVMHSVTKYLSGHSDLVQGVLVTRSPELFEKYRMRRTFAGAIPGALECYLSLRGLRTLSVRFERQQANAAELATRLAAHPKVTRVRYTGLASDPGHERAARLFKGHGAMVSFEVAGGAAAADKVCAAVQLITHATSLGGVESLIERRAQYAGDASFGVPEALLRFSVGIENVDDIWADLEQALG